MDPEKKEDDSTDFGKVIDILHSKQKLPSLRTYQGDVAEFMKEKNESVISVAVKEKEREQKREEAQTELVPESQPKAKQSNFQINFTMLLLSIVLLAGGGSAIFYIFKYISQTPSAKIPLSTTILPYNQLLALSNINNKNLQFEFQKISLEAGINLVKISDEKGHLLGSSQELFNLLEMPSTMTLRRILEDNFAVGAFADNSQISYFVILTVNDFGVAFASMLDWEASMAKDLAFLNKEDTPNATSTAKEVFVWKDLIVKNKDMRALINQKNKAKIAYTFLDKNTILITNNLGAIGEVSSIYASRFVAR